MSLTKEQIIEAISAMSVMDVMELITIMEEKFGVTAASVSPNVNVQVNDTVEVNSLAEEKTEFSVVLKAVGTNKIAIIKTVRSAIGLGLKEAKDLVESAPVTIKEGINQADAGALKTALEEVGAEVEIK